MHYNPAAFFALFILLAAILIKYSDAFELSFSFERAEGLFVS